MGFDDTTLILLALVAVAGTAYMMNRSTKADESTAARQGDSATLFKRLVEEGVSEETARQVIDVTPIETPFQEAFFNAILKDSADEYLATNRTSYAQYDEWQRVRAHDLPSALGESVFTLTTQDIQDIGDQGPFSLRQYDVSTVANPALIFVKEAEMDRGFLTTKANWLLLIQTVDVVTTEKAIVNVGEDELVNGLSELLTTYFSNKISLTLEEAMQTTENPGDSLDPQLWAVLNGFKVPYADELAGIPQLVQLVKEKYLPGMQIQTDELDKVLNLYIDISAALAKNISVHEAHVFYSDEQRAQIKESWFEGMASASILGMPSSLEELRGMIVRDHGSTEDKLEELRINLETVGTLQQAIDAINSPPESFGEAHTYFAHLIRLRVEWDKLMETGLTSDQALFKLLSGGEAAGAAGIWSPDHPQYEMASTLEAVSPSAVPEEEDD